MYSDLFDPPLGRAGRTDSAGTVETPPVVSFKAGKIQLAREETFDAAAPSYSCQPDTTTRGMVRLVWTGGALQWQWMDRRDQTVLERYHVADYPNSKFERVTLPEETHPLDRIYVWTKQASDKADPTSFEMYWMQDEAFDKEEETVKKVNEYLANPALAAPPPAPSGETRRGILRTSTATTSSSAGGASSSTTTRRPAAGAGGESQVDALSSILENLGMPQTESTSAASSPAAAAPTGVLTLSDLQGAMAGLSQPTGDTTPALNEVVTPAAITGILENEAARNRLLEFLPEGQRSMEHLEDNLRSPVVQQTLRTLSAALVPDEDGDMSGFYSVLANFSLDPADGQEAMAANNPIQAFLDCLAKSVQKEDEEEMEEAKEESKEE